MELKTSTENINMDLKTLVKKLESIESILWQIPCNAIIVFDTNYYYHFLSGPALTDSGYDKELFYHRTLQEAFNDEDIQAFKPLYDRVLSGEEFSLMFSGTNHVDYQVKFLPIGKSGGKIEGGLILISKISSLESKAYEQVVKFSADGIFVMNADGKFVFSNDVFLQRLDRTFKEINQLKFSDLSNNFLIEHKNWKQLYRQIKINKNVILAGNFIDKDGVNNIVELNMSHLIFNNKDSVVAIARDVSDRAKLKYKEVEYKKLKDLNEFRQNFLTQISHEIRTPLNGILGLSDILLGQEQDELIEPLDGKDLLSTIRESALHMSILMDNLLQISKLECGISTVASHDVSLDQLLHWVTKLFELQAKRKNLLIHTDLVSMDYKLRSDRFKLEQIVTNLVSNAIKYTNEGHITISSRISVESATHSNIEISVEDTGIGIPIDEEHNLFKQYSRLNNVFDSSVQESGTGVGLWLTQQLAQELGLEIKYVRCNHGGSRFSVQGQFEKVQQHQVNPTRSINFKNSGKILLVEDNPINVKVTSLMLNKFNAEYDTAINGRQALDLYRDGKYAIVLLDIEMPVLNGYATLKQLKRLHTNLPPIIALTANAYAGYENILFEKGFDGYLPKPMSIESLKTTLIKFMSK